MNNSPKPKRRWYQFSLLTLLIVVTLFTATLFAWPHAVRWVRLWQLVSYDGQDIRELDDREKVERLITALIPESIDARGLPPAFGFQTWYVWRLKTAEPYLLVLRVRRQLLLRISDN